MQKLSGGAHFIRFRMETPFLDKLSPKNQNCQFKLKFGTNTKLYLQNSMALFTFSVLDRKYYFWTNLVQKIKLFTLS